MRRLRERFVTAVSAACTLGVFQAVVEVVVVVLVYRDVVLAPRDFMGIRFDDGYAKALSWVLETLGAGPTPGRFLGPGPAEKFALLPAALGVGVSVGALVGASLALLTAPLGERRAPATARGFLVWLVALQAVVHAWTWAIHVHLPEQPTWLIAARNALRSFLYDGTAVAFVALGLGAWLSLLGLRRLGQARALAGALCVGLAGLAYASVSAGPAGIEGRPPGSMAPSTQAAGDQGAPVAEPLGLARGYNVILISVDTLRADHTSAYGYERDTTPVLRELARDGVRFANSSSTTSWTLPAHLSMLTGRLQLGHGVLNDRHRLATDVPTLAEVLQQAGYATGAIVSAPYLHHRYGFDRGFDHYDDETVHWKTHGESYKYVTAPLVQDAAETWLQQNARRRFFLFLHYWDPHYDYAPGKPYDTMFDPDYRGSITGDDFYFNPRVNRHMERRDLEHLIALYDGEIRLVDDHLGLLRETLEALGIDGKTILIVTGDHGEEFFEHGYKGHRRSLYDEVLRVPLVIHVPGVRATKPVVEMESSIADIPPTVLSLLGLRGPNEVDGIDLARVGFGDAPEWNRRTVAELYRDESLNVQVSIRESERKVIQHLNRPRMEVYDLREDPGEHDRLPPAAEFVPSLVERLLAYLNPSWASYRRRLGSGEGNALEIDAETQERLRALGYAQ